MELKHSPGPSLAARLLFRPGTSHSEDSCTESSVDDLGTCRGVVLSRAATILRSIETQPPTGRFVKLRLQPFLMGLLLLRGRSARQMAKSSDGGLRRCRRQYQADKPVQLIRRLHRPLLALAWQGRGQPHICLRVPADKNDASRQPPNKVTYQLTLFPRNAR